jgi:hypothetical protein
VDGQSSLGGLVCDSLRRLFGCPEKPALLPKSSGRSLDMLMEGWKDSEPDMGKDAVGSKADDPDADG